MPNDSKSKGHMGQGAVSVVPVYVIEDDLVEEAVTRATAALDCDGHGDALRNAVGREQVACSLDLGKLRHGACLARPGPAGNRGGFAGSGFPGGLRRSKSPS